MILVLLISFFSGANFFAVLLFWPTEVYNLYGNEPIEIGLRALPIGFGIIFGAAISLILIGITKGRTTVLMVFWTCAMTAFTGSLSIARPGNLSTVYPLITFSAISVGAVIIPSSIIAQIVCPTELIGTITAVTLSIRYIGGTNSSPFELITLSNLYTNLPSRRRWLHSILQRLLPQVLRAQHDDSRPADRRPRHRERLLRIDKPPYPRS